MILLEVTPLTTREQRALVYLVIMILIHFGLRLLKGTKLEFLYTGWKMFWVILFATLAINFAKTEIKKWWNKD
jgi:hypothetical protein